MLRKINIILKMLFDYVICFVSILLVSPLLLLISLLIYFEDKGPIIFKQKRIGYKGREFNIYKFRTMCVGAEKIGDGIKVKSKHDPRITKIGYFLRKTSLDELPQLINILLGDMSIVGPRPPVTYHPYEGYKNYPENIKKRFDMKPGLTGLVQVRVRNGVNWEKRFPIDIEYIETFNVLLDLKIILLTAYRVVKPQDIELKVKPNEGKH